MNENSNIRVLLLLKVNQLKREELPGLTYQNLLDYLFNMRWKDYFPDNLNDIVTDVLSIKAEEIVSYLSYQAIVDSSKHTIADYEDLL